MASSDPVEAKVLPFPSIRAANSDEDVIAIHAFMLAHAAAEMAEATVDAELYMETIYSTVRDGAGLMAIVEDRLVGYLGLWESRHDYSRETFLRDRGFFVLPEYRGGPVGRMLIQEARGIAASAGLHLKIIDINPTKKRRPRGQIALSAEILGFRPQGRIITFYPQRTN